MSADTEDEMLLSRLQTDQRPPVARLVTRPLRPSRQRFSLSAECRAKSAAGAKNPVCVVETVNHVVQSLTAGVECNSERLDSLPV